MAIVHYKNSSFQHLKNLSYEEMDFEVRRVYNSRFVGLHLGCFRGFGQDAVAAIVRFESTRFEDIQQIAN